METNQSVMTVLTKLRWVACTVMLALLVSGLPRLAAVVISDHQATLTLDICHPLQPVDNPSGSSLGVALIPAPPVVSTLVEIGAFPEPVLTAGPQFNEAPDPPPPKTLA